MNTGALNQHQPLQNVQVNQLAQQQPPVQQQGHHGVQLPHWLTQLPRTLREVRDHVGHTLQHGAEVLRGKFAQAGVATADFFRNIGIHLKAWVAPDTLAKHHPTFNVTLGGNQVTLDGRILMTKLPIGVTNNQITQIQQNIQQKVTRGEQLYRDIVGGNPPARNCTDQDMTDLAWFLQVKAEAKTGQHFRDGSVSLPAENDRLRTYLDSHPRAYQRDSSHINHFQHQPNGSHHGIDATGSNPFNLDNVLPYGLKTMLYGKVAQDGNRLMQHDRLFVKLEVHGCPWMNKVAMKLHGAPFDVTGPQGNFKRTWTEIGHSIGHLWTTIAGNPKLPGGHFQLMDHKERVPEQMKDDFKAMQKLADTTGDHALVTMLGNGNPRDKSSGVRVMYHNARTAVDHLTAKLNRTPDEDRLLQDLNHFVQGITGNAPLMDNIDDRFGEEVIFQHNDF